MGAALDHLAERARGRRRVAVLGDMAELGQDAAAYHGEVGAAAGRAGVDVLVALGPLARGYLEGAEGVDERLWAPSLEQGLPALRALLTAGRLRARQGLPIDGARGRRGRARGRVKEPGWFRYCSRGSSPWSSRSSPAPSSSSSCAATSSVSTSARRARGPRDQAGHPDHGRAPDHGLRCPCRSSSSRTERSRR